MAESGTARHRARRRAASCQFREHGQSSRRPRALSPMRCGGSARLASSSRKMPSGCRSGFACPMPKPNGSARSIIGGGCRRPAAIKPRARFFISLGRSLSSIACCWPGRARMPARRIKRGSDLASLPQRWTPAGVSAQGRGFHVAAASPPGPALGAALRAAEQAWIAADFPADHAAIERSPIGRARQAAAN